MIHIILYQLVTPYRQKSLKNPNRYTILLKKIKTDKMKYLLTYNFNSSVENT